MLGCRPIGDLPRNRPILPPEPDAWFDAHRSIGRRLTWEYPRGAPHGDQVDLVEVMDRAGGRIAHHRVYWGWAGFRALTGRAGR
ncbi:hypothetical protein MKK75_28730 [Methylobacterium sp. J-030]|uniref:hypothetical protein n=1 Tax=Methylobacterium sp. J-030 TaxID=2836627 RepID=UPI001FBA9076|nr:hypothetical protein [Methylobacterium sp. J-030]MCJ2072731.1 hypothetical protein [Methylobacterium sp. J-030]